MLRSCIFVAGLALAVVVVACHSPGGQGPVPTEQVEVYMPGFEPSEKYETIATIRKMVSLETPDSVVIMIARADAASKGADALLITELREYDEGRLDQRITSESQRQKRLIGKAVYFPDRRKQ